MKYQGCIGYIHEVMHMVIQVVCMSSGVSI
jgi:hypothetical protein